MKNLLLFAAFLVGCSAFSQVGIGNTDPKASLDISAKATPDNTDGLLIPRIDDFPSPTPTADQDGMIVFITGDGVPAKGFYYWDQDAGPAAWVAVTGGSVDDADFYEIGTTTAPDNITDDIFTQGRMALGKTTVGSTILDIDNTNRESAILINGNSSLATSYGLHSILDGTSLVAGVFNEMTGSSTGKFGIRSEFTGITGGGISVGANSRFESTGPANNFGVYNTFISSGSTGTEITGVRNWFHATGSYTGDLTGIVNDMENNDNGLHIGVDNNIIGTGTGEKYGTRTIIPLSAGGLQYGIYSDVRNATGYAGYFLGRTSLGTGTTNRYLMPSVDGTNGQVMTTNGAGVLTFQDAGSDADWYEADTTTAPTSNAAEIFTNGNVGIGISNPDNPLHIGTITPFDLSYDNTGQDGVFVTGGGDNSGNNAIGGSISFGPPAGTRAEHRKSAIASVQTGGDVDFTGLAFYVHGNAINQSPMVEAMRITHARNVGINNNAPSANLDVIGTMQFEDGNEAAGYVLSSDASGNASWTDPSTLVSGDADWFEEGTSTAPNAITDDIYTQGNVAIGKNTADYPLDIELTGTLANPILTKMVDNSTGTGDHVGIQQTLTGSHNEGIKGIETFITNTGTGLHTGITTSVQNGSGNQVGMRNTVNGNLGDNTLYSGSVFDSGSASTASQTGVNVSISQPSSQISYGVFSSLNATGASASGIKYGFYNLIDGGVGTHYGVYNDVRGTENNTKYGTYNLFGIGSTNTGGVLYGTYNAFGNSITSTSDKYGSYTQIPSTLGGTHYGVYSDVRNPTGFSGYFLGRVSLGNAASNRYIMPAADGSSGQIMTTDGSGNITFQNPTGDTDWTISGNNISRSLSTARTLIGTTTPGSYNLTITNNSNTIDIGNITNGADAMVINKASTSGNGLVVNQASSFNTTQKSAIVGTNILNNFEARLAFSDASIAETAGVKVSNANLTYSEASGFLYRANQATLRGGNFYGSQIDLSVNINAGTLYGYKAEIDGPGNAPKYGLHVTVPSSSGGTNYGIYSDVQDTGDWAGYFIGKTYVSTKLGVGTGADNPDGFVDIRANNSAAAPNLNLVDIGSSGARINFRNTGTTNGNVWTFFGDTDNTTSNSRFYLFHQGTGNILRVLGDGKVGIMRDPVTNTLEVNGAASKSTAGDWLANSDKRLKKNIKTIDSKSALEKITSLRGVSYEWNDDKTGNKRPDGIQYGFIAQELMEVFPEHVSKDNLGFYQTAYGTYDALYVQALKEQQLQIEKLQTENEKLKEKVLKFESLEARLSALENGNTRSSEEIVSAEKK